jgi:hypothetical protein
MLTPDDRFCSNDKECAAKVIDGEAVIINLLNGTYYSLDKAGGAIWELLSEGYALGEVVEELTRRYDVDSEQAQRDVGRVVQELLGERLLVVIDEVKPSRETGMTEAMALGISNRLPYEKPELTTFRDMAELFALDPPMPRLEDIVWNEPGESSNSGLQG